MVRVAYVQACAKKWQENCGTPTQFGEAKTPKCNFLQVVERNYDCTRR